MLLSQLLSRVGAAGRLPDTQITLVTDSLADVIPGSLFVCIRGEKTNGETLAPAAFARGAAAAVSETPVPGPCVVVPNARLARSLLAAAFYGDPHKRLSLVGITGTNGKTSTAQYLSHFLRASGVPDAVLGTEGFQLNGSAEKTGRTTPESGAFFAALKKAADAGAEVLTAEISSQALAQYRVHGARFKLGIFTNLGRDHLDYHKTAASLLAAKTRLCGLSDAMLLNADDPAHEAFLAANAGGKSYTYGLDRPADFTAAQPLFLSNGAEFTFLHGKTRARLRIPAVGRFGVYNALAALSAGLILGLDPGTLFPAAANLPQVPGRMQRVFVRGVRVVVDFAHTPEALKAALSALSVNGEKPAVVFGCGGDRDRGKRPLMGAAAANGASFTVLTSDNPRGEDPLSIINEIRAGMPRTAVVYTEPDRRRAISLALSLAKPGGTVLLAGKGSETVQITGGAETPFSDLEEALRAGETQPGRNT